MYYINQLDYPHIRYEHDLDNGGAPEEKCTAAAAACGPCCLCMIVENMTFGHLELTDCLELSAKLGANRQRGTSLKILGPAVAEKYGLTYDTTNDVKKLVEHLQRGGMAIANSGGDREGYVGLFTHGGHYITILSTDGKDACILDPSYKEGKYEEEGRQGKAEVHEPFVYCSLDVLMEDCSNRDPSMCELYIVEGDSALGSVKLSRDAEFQGIMPVRGKILNCLKADYDRIFKSDIITDLIRVLGCGVEVQTKKAKDLSSFDLANLRWNKVVICTDADVDGYQIRTLILTMIYRLCPTLIEQGYVYIAESPLYEINCKDKTWFAYTESEKGEILKQLEGKKVSINRSKGLGENDPEMMWMTTMNPETRRLIKVMPEDMVLTQQMFDLLLGDNLQGRKDHIAENGYKYLDQLDVS